MDTVSVGNGAVFGGGATFGQPLHLQNTPAFDGFLSTLNQDALSTEYVTSNSRTILRGTTVLQGTVGGNASLQITSVATEGLVSENAVFNSTVTFGAPVALLYAPAFDGRISSLEQDVPGVPSGVVSQYAGNVSPTGYLDCDGSTVSRSAYANLFAVVGTTYGSSSADTFDLPVGPAGQFMTIIKT